MPKVDYSQIEERDFSPLPDGTYDANLTGFELVEPKSSDKFPYYNLEYTLLGEQGEPQTNRKVWDIVSLSPKALWRFKQIMVRLGAVAEDMSPDSTVDTDEVVAQCVGAECRLRLKQETYTTNSGEERVKNTVQDVQTPAYVV